MSVEFSVSGGVVEFDGVRLPLVSAVDEKVLKRYFAQVKPVDGCWEWQDEEYPMDYGRFAYRGRTRPTHRLAYEWFVGPIGEGMLACHKCDNRPCVRPDHLFQGTTWDNCQDAINKGITKRGSMRRQVWVDESMVGVWFDRARGGFVAECFGMPGCAAVGRTRGEAMQALEAAMLSRIAVERNFGDSVPPNLFPDGRSSPPPAHETDEAGRLAVEMIALHHRFEATLDLAARRRMLTEFEWKFSAMGGLIRHMRETVDLPPPVKRRHKMVLAQ